MFKKIDQYLLTHYPLVWNTRVVWTLATCFLLHLLFFLSGYLQTSASTLQNHYSIYRIGSGNMYGFSILSSIALIILWLVFFLRNNAFKQFYIIDRFYLSKQFSLLVIIIISSITFYESFRIGAVLKIRSITSKEQLIAEVNAVNLAFSFLPLDKDDFFKLNACGKENRVNLHFDYTDSININVNNPDYARIRETLREKDAFSYRHYCINYINFSNLSEALPPESWSARKNSWIDKIQEDSILFALAELKKINSKYSIYNQINDREWVDLVFKDSLNSISKTLNQQYYYDNERRFDASALRTTLEIITDSYDSILLSESDFTPLLPVLYTALCFAILLFCYRVFNRRIFLISLIGTIVWGILFILIASSLRGEDGFSIFYFILFFSFLISAFLLIRSKTSKTLTGILLSWHLYMLPFIFLLALKVITDKYTSVRLALYRLEEESHKLMQESHPFLSWVNDHTGLIIWLNLLFVFLYCAFLFPYMVKKWKLQPDE